MAQQVNCFGGDTNGFLRPPIRSTSSGITCESFYDAFGTKHESASATDPFAFGAQYGYTFDREIGLYSCGERYYDPSRVRWTTRDTRVLRAGRVFTGIAVMIFSGKSTRPDGKAGHREMARAA